MTQIIESNVTKLGFLRHPETHEKFLPFTHWMGVLGLDTHIVDLVGGTLHQSTLGINGTTRTVYAPTAFTDSGFYAPLDAGTSYNLLMSNGSGAPSWTTFLSADNGYLKKTANGGWSLDPYGGGAKESVMDDGSVIVASSSATAGLRKQTGPSTYEYQKISFAAITNDTSTDDNAVTIILNGNFN